MSAVASRIVVTSSENDVGVGLPSTLRRRLVMDIDHYKLDTLYVIRVPVSICLVLMLEIRAMQMCVSVSMSGVYLCELHER